MVSCWWIMSRIPENIIAHFPHSHRLTPFARINLNNTFGMKLKKIMHVRILRLQGWKNYYYSFEWKLKYTLLKIKSFWVAVQNGFIYFHSSELSLKYSSVHVLRIQFPPLKTNNILNGAAHRMLSFKYCVNVLFLLSSFFYVLSLDKSQKTRSYLNFYSQPPNIMSYIY